MAQDEMEMEYDTDQQERLSRPKLKWTIMIYLAGDNNLSANSVAIMQELEAAAHRPDVRVLACFDSNTPRPKGARYLEINHRRCLVNTGMDWGLHNDMVPPELIGAHAVVAPDFCNLNPSSIKIPDEPVAREGLSRFLKFALKNHRAERYMLIVFGHGSLVAGNTFLVDNNPPSFLRLKDFAEVLERHFSKDNNDHKPKLDILACDNCVMNGIEAAYQIRKQVDFMLGSEGLMLAVGWPYRKIINAVVDNPNTPSKEVALKVLKACARNLLDFSLMDRSSEQAVCDLTKFSQHNEDDIVSAVKCLAEILIEGLKIDKHGEVVYKLIRDAVRLARLEAQSYWDETFVDLYDFCSLLIDRCNDFLKAFIPLMVEVAQKILLKAHITEEEKSESSDDNVIIEEGIVKKYMLKTPEGELIKEIEMRCWRVLEEVKNFIPFVNRGKTKLSYSYYVGPELQYSHGLSIYFPWTLPQDPIIFEPTSWQVNNFRLKTAFDEYKEYDFAKYKVSGWADFLESFFRATLRGVRRFDYDYKDVSSRDDILDLLTIDKNSITEREALPIDLRKSSSDAGREDDVACPKIKNYPRRFYVSPADCLCRCDLPLEKCKPIKGRKYCVSYLGWNVRGLLAEVIGLPPLGESSAPEHTTDDIDEDESERELAESE